MTRPASEAERAIRVPRLAAALAAIGISIEVVARPHVGTPWVQIAVVAVCGAIALWLTMSRRPPSIARGNAAFLIVIAAILVALWTSSQELAALGVPWVPFRAHQLGMITVAMLAPPRLWVGIVAILGFLGAAVVQCALFEPAIRMNFAYGEPWATVIFTVFAIPLLWHRLRAFGIEYEAARAETEAEAFERLARAMVALRDLSNTPLQTCSNVVALLRAPAPRPAELADRLERALGRLVELEQLTRPYEERLTWTTGDEAWDPKEILRETADRPTP